MDITRNKLARFRLERQLPLAMQIFQSAYQHCESGGSYYRKYYPDLASKPLTSVIELLTVKMTNAMEWFYQPISAMNSA